MAHGFRRFRPYLFGFKLEEIVTATEVYNEGPLSWWKGRREKRGL